LSSYQNI